MLVLVALLLAGSPPDLFARDVGDSASSIDKDLIRRVVRRHHSEVQACYAAGLARDPALTGRVVIRFTIGTRGKVIDSVVASTDLPDDAVARCIAKSALGWRFASGAQIVVSYPFVLVPA